MVDLTAHGPLRRAFFLQGIIMAYTAIDRDTMLSAVVEALDLVIDDVDHDDAIGGPVWFGFRLFGDWRADVIAADAEKTDPYPHGRETVLNGIRIVELNPED